MKRSTDALIAQVDWSLVTMVTIGLWLSSSLVVDLIVVPSLSAAGMMAEPGFINAGHLLFSIFNHIEMLFAGIVVSGCLVLRQQGYFSPIAERWAGLLALALLAIAMGYTYGLTPAITDLGFDMAAFNGAAEMPAAMMPLHWLYWGLEGVKFVLGVTLITWCYRPLLAAVGAE